MIEILNRYTKAVLYTSATADTIAAAVLETRTRGADLGGAYLRGADLSGADLSGAYLRGAVGLLPDGIVPLQILGTKHFIIVRSPGMITIGCKHHEIAWWREHAVALGKTENYTPAQITEYAAHIEYCAAWMKSYGVDEVAA